MYNDKILLKDKVAAYKQVLENTRNFRQLWKDSVKLKINIILDNFLSSSGLFGKVTENNELENLESIMLDLGRSSSGIAQSKETAEIKNFMIKNNGGLIYQQLFNGKIMVMVHSPHIEGYGEPKDPVFLEIITPSEITDSLIYRHIENFIEIITEWEDFDDESPKKKTVFQPIGFQHSVNST